MGLVHNMVTKTFSISLSTSSAQSHIMHREFVIDAAHSQLSPLPHAPHPPRISAPETKRQHGGTVTQHGISIAAPPCALVGGPSSDLTSELDVEKLTAGLTSRLACFSSRFILRQTYTLIPATASPRATKIAPPAAIPAIAPALRPSLAWPPAGGGGVGGVGGGGNSGGGVGFGGGAGGHGGLGGLAANVTGGCHSAASAVSLNVMTCVENKGCSAFEGLSQRPRLPGAFYQPRTIGSLGIWAALAGHTGIVFDMGDYVEPHAVHLLLCARRVPGVRLAGRLV